MCIRARVRKRVRVRVHVVARVRVHACACACACVRACVRACACVCACVRAFRRALVPWHPSRGLFCISDKHLFLRRSSLLVRLATYGTGNWARPATPGRAAISEASAPLSTAGRTLSCKPVTFALPYRRAFRICAFVDLSFRLLRLDAGFAGPALTRAPAAPDFIDIALRPGAGPSRLYALTSDGHLLLFGGLGARTLHRWVELGRPPAAGRPLAVSVVERSVIKSAVFTFSCFRCCRMLSLGVVLKASAPAQIRGLRLRAGPCAAI